MIKPLEDEQIAAVDASATKAERFWMYVPILGWAFAQFLWNERTRPIVKNIKHQLQSRAKPEPLVWGENAERVSLAQYVCAVAKKEMGWPNDYFIPNDPAGIVFWAHDDGLDVEAAVTDIEKHLGIKLNNDEVEAWFSQTLGEVVAFLWRHQHTSRNQENIGPPPTGPALRP